jgi:ANTAR domain
MLADAHGLLRVVAASNEDTRLTELMQLQNDLQAALSSRVIIEQLTGLLAQHVQLSMGQAFDQMRRYAGKTTGALPMWRETSPNEHSNPTPIAIDGLPLGALGWRCGGRRWMATPP